MLSSGLGIGVRAVGGALCWVSVSLSVLLFDRGSAPPKFVLYLGRVLPPAVIAMLLVYCLKDMSFASPAGFLPQLIAGAAVVILHLWRHNNLLSIFAGTAVYMVLVQAVFV